MKNKKDDDGPVSDFAKRKSIRQQREFLPIFSVRDELLNVVRENAVVVIVGYVAIMLVVNGRVRCCYYHS